MFLSKTDERDSRQELQPYVPAPESSFGEVFAASVGHVIDEELSISSSLNNDMYRDRERTAQSMVDDGFDLTPYTDNTGLVDYDRLSNETDFGIKTDRELYDERNALLESRRNYSDDVKERGSGMAQFVGEMTGYMLDPINVATLPVGASVSALRGLSTLARVSRVAAVEGGVAMGSEIAIQPFVFAHKNEIGSPYSLEDSLMAIGTAAIGGAAIGGAAAGAAGFLRRAGKIADDYPDDMGAQGSRRAVDKLAADMEANPDRVVRPLRREYADTPDSIRDITDVERDLADEIFDNSGKITKTGEARVFHRTTAEAAEQIRATGKMIGKEDGVFFSTKKAGQTEGYGDTVVEMNVPLNRLELDDVFGDEAHLRIATGRAGEQVDVSSYLSMGRKEAHEALVKTDIDYARKLEKTRLAQSEQLPTPETYDVVPGETPRKIEDFEADDLAKYEARGEDGVVYAGGEVVSARNYIDERTAEIDGLDSVRVCAIG